MRDVGVAAVAIAFTVAAMSGAIELTQWVNETYFMTYTSVDLVVYTP